MKKFIALLLVALMAMSCFSLASCGGEESSVASDSSVNASDEASNESVFSTEESAESAESAESVEESATESTEESAESAESTESVEESAAESTEESTTESAEESAESSEESIENSSEADKEESSEEASLEDPEDAASLEETTSYKLISSIDKVNGFYFAMTASQQTAKISVNTGVLGDKYFSETVSPFGPSKQIVKEGKKYILNPLTKTYTVSDSEQTIDEIISGFIDSLFGSVEYVKTINEEKNGVVYLVDCFKSTGDGSEAKIYISSENKVEYMLINGLVFEAEMSEALPDGCFDIPADYMEASAQ